ncbi:MAG: Gfo/Idh/MocA family oxidoreductase [Opitutales bacterium]
MMKMYTLFRFVFVLFLLCLPLRLTLADSEAAEGAPIRFAVAGISHGHANWIFNRDRSESIELLGIYEPNEVLVERYMSRFNLSGDLFYSDLDEMLDAVEPEAVAAFGSIYEHMGVVEACAPRGIHVMVEKPLATTIEHATRMERLAGKHDIHLITNYETSWYPSTKMTHRIVTEQERLGTIRKAVFHHGHQGPKEIGVSEEFLEWLTDPVLNGGGALIDFGCYGANIMTYLMEGQEPVSVTAVTRQYKPEIYEEVDDEATIILDYPQAQGIIQASWNWPFNRKDMVVYGETGYVAADDRSTLRLRTWEDVAEQRLHVTDNDIDVQGDPFLYFAAVVRGAMEVPENGLYSLENNVTVVRILDAARESARTGKTVMLKETE